MTQLSSQRGIRTTDQPAPHVDTSDNNVLDSVSLVVRIIEGLAAFSAPVGVSELARTLNESKARVHRNLASLRHFGIVEQEVSSERYCLGWRLYQLGQSAGMLSDLRRLVDPYLHRLRDLTGLSAVLSVPMNGEALVIAAVDSQRPVCITVRVGSRPSPHAAAQGRIALAWANDVERQRLLGSALDRPTPESMHARSAVVKRLALIRERLWEDAANEILVGVNLLAAPILREGEELSAIIGVVGSVQELPTPPRAVHLALVRGAAAAISQPLGGRSYREKGIAVPRELE